MVRVLKSPEQPSHHSPSSFSSSSGATLSNSISPSSTSSLATGLTFAISQSSIYNTRQEENLPCSTSSHSIASDDTIFISTPSPFENQDEIDNVAVTGYSYSRETEEEEFSPIVSLSNRLTKALIVSSSSEATENDSDQDSPIKIATVRRLIVSSSNSSDKQSSSSVSHYSSALEDTVENGKENDLNFDDNVEPHIIHIDRSSSPFLQPRTPSPQISKHSNVPPKTIFKTPMSHVHSKLSLPARKKMAINLFQEFNQSVFKGELPSDIPIEWNNRLNKTAGKAHCKRSFDPSSNSYVSTYKIELASKVTDTESKLRNTLAHELCHLAVFYFHGLNQPPHGPAFRKYGDMFESEYSISKKGPESYISIETCHSYDIDYKFAYVCSNGGCGYTYNRHSKSIDTERKVCGKCKGRLELFDARRGERMDTGGTRLRKDGTPMKVNPFGKFVKDNFAAVRQELVRESEKVSQKDVMEKLAARWKNINIV